jgi:hypothetical protein
MILGNKNDMEEKRVVSRDRGEAVSDLTNIYISFKHEIYCYYPILGYQYESEVLMCFMNVHYVVSHG